ncbi:MAG TPA: prepilin-type N-terminal cleavage/methylation domain-containing protein [Syntrophorhabdaceae bacterium]|nr:prepilin-type N-terminal cleavage/methylation domain-containing protein [Syntrophorhabdaceae bacterium]
MNSEPRQSTSKRTILRNRGGFTLLEVLVAFVLLTTTVTVILQLFSSNMRALSVSEDYATSVVRLESKMREILDTQELAVNSWNETTTDGYRFDIDVTNAYDERTRDMSQKILEVSVTMHWRQGIKDKSMTLNTLKTVKQKV